ncbi:helix-turn-helix domain-containing protein [Niameybacter massiliensis]|uniref:helix-turn-helix domain-containing protein n=1 Tax=Niameybacter massiliensis TaxID=1658108 RepID=UPI0006B52328|nr:XRE family transcriptional regulator [Niameybacter massiliensis]
MTSLNLVRIGNILKSQRLMLGLSIRDLSAKCGVSAGTISQIETGKTAPNLVSVYTLCETLGFPISALFVEDCDERISLVRKNERNSFTRNTSNGQSIDEALIIKGEHQMWGGVITMPPHTSSGAFYYHEGEEFIFILQGNLTFELENYPPYELYEGDTLYYPNEIGHRWENKSDQETKLLIVSTSEFEQGPSITLD